MLVCARILNFLVLIIQVACPHYLKEVVTPRNDVFPQIVGNIGRVYTKTKGNMKENTTLSGNQDSF